METSYTWTILESNNLTLDIYGQSDAITSDSTHAWDAMSNPFFQAMAEKEGYNWNNLLTEFNNEVGAFEDQEFKIQTQEEIAAKQYSKKGGGYYTKGGQSAEYKHFGNYQAAVDWANDNGYDEDDIKFSSDSVWGTDYDKWTDRFNGWQTMGRNIIKKYKDSSAPIIARGPRASDYGIVRADDNMFKHLGLHKAPPAPRELATNYKWNLAKTVTSNIRYNTPPGLQEVNLSGDA